MRLLKSFVAAATLSLLPLESAQGALSPKVTLQSLPEQAPPKVLYGVTPTPSSDAQLQGVLDPQNLSNWAGLPMLALDVAHYLSAAQERDPKDVAIELRNDMAVMLGDTIAKMEETSVAHDIDPIMPFVALVKGGLSSDNVATEYVLEDQRLCIMNMPNDVRHALDESVAMKVILYALGCSKTYEQVELTEDFALPLKMYAEGFAAALNYMGEDMVDEYIGGFVSQELQLGDNYGSGQLVSRYMSLAGYADPSHYPDVAQKLMDRIAVFRMGIFKTAPDDQTAYIVNEASGQGITAAYAQVLLRIFDTPDFDIKGFDASRLTSNMILPTDLFKSQVTQSLAPRL